MRLKARLPMIPAMTSPPSSRKIVLVPASNSAETDGRPPLRRYRVARLRFDTPDASQPKRFDYLKRTFD